jgi:dinuclear metal center YbgI/SA1388 family protein
VIQRHELTAFLDDYLACASFNDYAPNGLQIEGKLQIHRICTAVTASHDIIKRANHLKADALLVHHGYFWRGEEPVLTGMKRQRVGSIMSHDLNLYAYHLPLDCHPELGNNACIGRFLEAQDITQHVAGKIPNLLWAGHFESSVSLTTMMQQLTQVFQRKPLHIPGSSKTINRIAWCSGGAQDYIVDAHRLGVDAYISGEISERTYYEAQELGVHYFACGHHATERFGIQALGELISKRFGITHQFLDTENPV